MLQAKKTGNKIKRKVFRFEETESSEEEEKSEAILNVEQEQNTIKKNQVLFINKNDTNPSSKYSSDMMGHLRETGMYNNFEALAKKIT